MLCLVSFGNPTSVPRNPGKCSQDKHQVKREDLKTSVENYYSGTTSAPPFSPSSAAVFIHLLIYCLLVLWTYINN